ncbi:MAG: response regulator transcription factor, partial [Finegoldia magna]|nr:response regulator transcription factor [Finegoldia magna]
GLDVLKKIRETSDIPAIMLTAFSDEEYKINAFTSLADGYIEKPFSLPVLKVRVESLIKKHYGNNETFNYKNTEVNFTSYTAKLNGKKVDVNAKELEILKYMIENEGQALTRMQIIDSVWKETDEIPFDRVIDVYIKELRKKLELDCIVTIRNVGYKLERK